MSKTWIKMEFSGRLDDPRWDDLMLVIGGEVPQMIKLADRYTVLDIHSETIEALENGHTGPLTIMIDGKEYTLTEQQWRDVAYAADDWNEIYLECE